MPEGVSEVAADLISRLLRVEPSERIGEAPLHSRLLSPAAASCCCRLSLPCPCLSLLPLSCFCNRVLW